MGIVTIARLSSLSVYVGPSTASETNGGQRRLTWQQGSLYRGDLEALHQDAESKDNEETVGPGTGEGREGKH